jgi:hypothetical protein
MMTIGSLPSASAFGIYNANVVQSLVTTIGKLISNELKAQMQKGSANSNNRDSISLDLRLGELSSEATKRDPGTRTSRRLAQQSQEDADLEEGDIDKEEDAAAEMGGDEDDEPEAAEDTEEGISTTRSTVSKQQQAHQRVKPRHLTAFLIDLSLHIAVFASQCDEHLLNTTADLLASIQYLCATRSEFEGTCAFSLFFGEFFNA